MGQERQTFNQWNAETAAHFTKRSQIVKKQQNVTDLPTAAALALDAAGPTQECFSLSCARDAGRSSPQE
jgi:hypothetical protein